jgi:heme-degrading monooxygenase HmoA
VTGPVARIWKAAGTPSGVTEYLAHFDEMVAPALAGVAGYLGVRIFRRATDAKDEILVVTEWESMEAVGAFAGLDPGRAVIHPAARAVLLHAGEEVEHYQVVRRG